MLDHVIDDSQGLLKCWDGALSRSLKKRHLEVCIRQMYLVTGDIWIPSSLNLQVTRHQIHPG